VVCCRNSRCVIPSLKILEDTKASEKNNESWKVIKDAGWIHLGLNTVQFKPLVQMAINLWVSQKEGKIHLLSNQ
jgi:hypothetical protein